MKSLGIHLLLVAIAATGCTELGTVGAPCDNARPCNPGLECLAGACEELAVVSPRDAGDPPIVDGGKKVPASDAGAGDGARDAGPRDAGMFDAGPVDAGPASVCGDGLIEAPEACDDENLTGGDGCSDRCEVEDGFECYGVLKSYCAAAAEVVHVTACTDLIDTAGDRLYLVESPLLECPALRIDAEKKTAIGMTSPPPELRLSATLAANALRIEGGGELILVNLQLSTTGNTERLLFATDDGTRLVLDQVLVGPTDDIAVEVEDATVHIRRSRFTATHGGLSLNTASAVIENTSFVDNGNDGEDSEFGAIRVLRALIPSSRLEGLTVVNNSTNSSLFNGIDCAVPTDIALSLVVSHDGEDATDLCNFVHSHVESLVVDAGTNFVEAPLFTTPPELTGPPALLDAVDAALYPALIFDLDGRRRGSALTVGAREP